METNDNFRLIVILERFGRCGLEQVVSHMCILAFISNKVMHMLIEWGNESSKSIYMLVFLSSCPQRVKSFEHVHQVTTFYCQDVVHCQ